MSKRTSKHTLDEKVNIVRQVVDENRSIYNGPRILDAKEGDVKVGI
ncbi:hypothetical protein [Salinicoccus sp. YB14-2]|nr:hypothetical protein [Salinicoccus sp. YB14-2]